MSQSDDRPWKAEDMLKVVVPDDGTPTSERIDRYFNNLEDLSKLTATEDVDANISAQAEPPAKPQQAVPSEAPIQVPHHTLIRCLGAGGFGQVWLAKNTLTEHYRACKLIPASKALELEGISRLKQKVPSHPGLFPIDDVGTVNDWLYCLMPLADAASNELAVVDVSVYEPLTLELHLSRHGRRPTLEAMGIGAQLAEAIRHLHACGVTHGDIKPANIMRLNGQWTLADYGLARDLSSPSGGAHTPGYVPPEGPGSTKADQYALGVVLMELLTSWPARMLADFRNTPIESFKLDADGPQLNEIIRRATELAPTKRFGSMDEFADALRSIAPRNVTSGNTRSRWLWPAATLVAALGLFGIGFVLFNLNKTTQSEVGETLVPAPLEVELFEVRHYRFDPETETLIATGAISADNPAARATDDVTVHARFIEPAFFYLLSLDTDGRVRPRMPASPTEPPAAAPSVDYPSDPATDPSGNLFNLSRGSGTQGFMLMASAEPLPAWSDWVAAHGEPTWSRESLPPNAVMLFDGTETRTLSTTRDPQPRRGRLILDPVDWAKAQQGISTRFIAFPVLPKEEN
jgi:serine/threonine protein kinase